MWKMSKTASGNNKVIKYLNPTNTAFDGKHCFVIDFLHNDKKNHQSIPFYLNVIKLIMFDVKIKTVCIDNFLLNILYHIATTDIDSALCYRAAFGGKKECCAAAKH